MTTVNKLFRVITDTICTIVWPIVPWILQVGVLGFGIYIFALQLTMREKTFRVIGNDTRCTCSPPNSTVSYKLNDTCDPKEFYESCSQIPACQNAHCHFFERNGTPSQLLESIFCVFTCLWCLFFLSAFSDMVLASVYSKWYWTYNKSRLPMCILLQSVTQTLRYHIGTLAFGSLIITICRLLRLMVEYVDHMCRKYPNRLTQAIMWVFRCFFWLFEKFMKFISESAYIMTAQYGTNFCTSAKKAFVLQVNNCLRKGTLAAVRDPHQRADGI